MRYIISEKITQPAQYMLQFFSREDVQRCYIDDYFRNILGHFFLLYMGCAQGLAGKYYLVEFLSKIMLSGKHLHANRVQSTTRHGGKFPASCQLDLQCVFCGPCLKLLRLRVAYSTCYLGCQRQFVLRQLQSADCQSKHCNVKTVKCCYRRDKKAQEAYIIFTVFSFQSRQFSSEDKRKKNIFDVPILLIGILILVKLQYFTIDQKNIQK